MNGLEKLADQHFFFGKELQIQRRVERIYAATPMNWLYHYFCGYGRGVTRMLAILIGHVILGAVLLCAANIPGLTEEKDLWPAAGEAFSDFHRALALSFGHAHGPLALNGTSFEDWVSDFRRWGWVGPVQTVLGVIILFFLLLTIRNRFRMR